jgi:radical SAM protein with 4Fe4S-binding SPASM domain
MAVNFYPTYTQDQLIAHYTNLSFSKSKACIYPWFFIAIRPNGDVTACSEYFLRGYVLGNLRKENILEILNSKKREYFLKVLKNEKFFPGCRRCILPINCK